MQARMKNPAFLLPDTMKALQATHADSEKLVPAKILGLVHLRASQINGCAVCLDLHVKLSEKDGETDQRMFTVAGWRDAPYFTDAERAALALTEAVTLLATGGVPDDVWADAARHFDEKQLAALLVSISMVNVWNRLNIATRQIAGAVSW
jgi:AhpD family alkylhydroperoxidase